MAAGLKINFKHLNKFKQFVSDFLKYMIKISLKELIYMTQFYL